MKLSVIVPVYNEEGNIRELISNILTNLSAIDFELIIVDDKSTDHTLNDAIENKNDLIKIISLEKNHGQSIAIKAGIDNASGEYVAILDGDMQNDPSDILKLYQKMKNSNADMVQGYRKNRHDSFAKKAPSRVANKIIRLFFKCELQDVGCSIKIFKKSIANSFIYFNGFHRYIPLIACVRGFNVMEVIVTHHPRLVGKSKYGIERIFPVCKHLFLLKINPLLLSQKMEYKIKAIY